LLRRCTKRMVNLAWLELMSNTSPSCENMKPGDAGPSAGASRDVEGSFRVRGAVSSGHKEVPVTYQKVTL
jgi:hypothetical protein